MTRNLIVIALGMLVAGVCDGQSVVKGHVYQLKKGGGYAPLEGVQVIATRDGPVAGPVVSDQNGEFRLVVPAGSPFLVTFYGVKRVPELQQLAGLSGVNGENRVQVTLLSPEEYQRLYARGQPLLMRLDCDLGRIPRSAEDAQKTIREVRDGLKLR